MVKEIRRIKDRSKAMYIRKLQNNGRIRKLLSDNGFIAYDTEDLERFKRNAHIGRPSKLLKEKQNETIQKQN